MASRPPPAHARPAAPRSTKSAAECNSQSSKPPGPALWPAFFYAPSNSGRLPLRVRLGARRPFGGLLGQLSFQQVEEDLGGAERHVHPQRLEDPDVGGVVDPGHGPGHIELTFG